MNPPETRQTRHAEPASSPVGQREIQTQQRVITFLRDTLGYTYLGHWQDREDNGNIEKDLLTGRVRLVKPEGVT